MQGYTDQLAPDGHPVRVVALGNATGFRVAFMDWGATWLSCLVPTSQIAPREVLLRSPNLEQHLQQNAYLGATIGRYANRIAEAKYTTYDAFEPRTFKLSPNDNGNSLHGGPNGFDSKRWQVESYDASKVVFSLVSEDGDQGFPGRIEVRACYQLGSDNSITASFEASTDKPCPVNITNHAYFNLASSHLSVLTHELQIQADQFLPVHKSGIPKGDLRSVAGSRFDFRTSRQIDQAPLSTQGQEVGSGYDHAFLLDPQMTTGLHPVASLLAPDRSMALSVATTKPALQVYTGNHLGGLASATGQLYAAHAGIALETSFLPDSPNHPRWPQPTSMLLPGQRYAYQTTFCFKSSP